MTMLTKPKQIELAQMSARRSALSLEIKGMKRRGISAYSIVKDEYGLCGNRESVYTQLCELIEKKKGEL